MPCLIVQGREIDCRDSVGGVAEVYLTEFVNVPQANITASSGVVTAATCSAGKRFFTYQLEKENAQFDEKATSSLESGTFVEQTLTFTTKKMSASQKNNMLTLLYNRAHVIVKDKNGVYHWMGRTSAADVTNVDATTGKAYGDMNGFSVTVSAKEPVFADTVSASIVASLQIGS